MFCCVCLFCFDYCFVVIVLFVMFSASLCCVCFSLYFDVGTGRCWVLNRGLLVGDLLVLNFSW